MDLTQKKCVPCEGGMPPLTDDEIKKFLPYIATEWRVLNNKKIRREYVLKNFVSAMALVNKVADRAETEGHHPDISISYNKVTIELWTHAIGGLSENDFIMAAKIDQL